MSGFGLRIRLLNRVTGNCCAGLTGSRAPGGIAMPSTKELVLKTENHIERNPRCYRYTSNRIPVCSDDVGCILGWMAHFSAEHGYGVLTPEAIARMTCDPLYACKNVGYNHFFKRLDECYPLYRGHWRSDATHAVAALSCLRRSAPRSPRSSGLGTDARSGGRRQPALRSVPGIPGSQSQS